MDADLAAVTKLIEPEVKLTTHELAPTAEPTVALLRVAVTVALPVDIGAVSSAV